MTEDEKAAEVVEKMHTQLSGCMDSIKKLYDTNKDILSDKPIGITCSFVIGPQVCIKMTAGKGHCIIRGHSKPDGGIQMIFQTASNAIVRLPDNLICGRLTNEDALVWAVGDGDEAVYTVTRETFLTMMGKLGDKEVE